MDIPLYVAIPFLLVAVVIGTFILGSVNITIQWLATGKRMGKNTTTDDRILHIIVRGMYTWFILVAFVGLPAVVGHTIWTT